MDIRNPKDRLSGMPNIPGPGEFAQEQTGIVPNETISTDTNENPIANRLGIGPLAKKYYNTSLGRLDKAAQEKLKSLLPGEQTIPGQFIRGMGEWATTMLPNIHDLKYNSDKSLPAKIVEGAFQPVKGFYFGDEDPSKVAYEGSKYVTSLGKEGDAGAAIETGMAGLMLPGVHPFKQVIKPLVKGAAKGVGKAVKATGWDEAMDLGWSRTVNYLTDPTQAILDKGTMKGVPQVAMTAIQKGGRLMREKLQPAVERLNYGAQWRIRRAKADAAKLEAESELLGNALSKPEIKLTDKLDFARLNRGSTVDNPAMEQLFKESRKRLKSQGVDRRMLKDFEEQQGKLYTKMFQSTEDLTNPHLRTLMETIDASVPEDQWFRQLHVRDAIADAIHDPNTSLGEVQALKAMFELPATIPENSLNASKFAMNAYLTRSLMKLRGKESLLVPPGGTPPPGYVKAKWGEFGKKGFYMDRDLALELESYEQIQKSAQGVFNKYFTTPWKTMKIILSPAAQIRNAFTNVMLNDIGGLPFYRMDIYKQAVQGMHKNHDTWKDFIKQTGGGGVFAHNELAQLAGKFKYDLEYKDFPGLLLSQVSKHPKNIYNMNEQLFKYAKYLHNIEKGMTKVDAAADAVIPTFNYSEITPMIAKARSHVVPFATWTSKVIPYTFEMTVKHPIRVGKWFAMFYGLQKYALEQAGMSEEEFETYRQQWPEYMQKGAYLLLPWRDSRDRLNMVDLTYMVPGLGDMREMTGKGLWESVFQHPAITIPSQLLTGKTFSGAPYRHEWQTPMMKRWEDIKHVWEATMPSWFMGSDYNKYVKVLSEQPGAMTMGQALASQFGMKMQPLDDEYMYRLHEATKKIHLTEMTTEMKREMRLAGDNYEKQQAIAEKYDKIRQAFLLEGLDQGEGDTEE
jgi:hypothetical protein